MRNDIHRPGAVDPTAYHMVGIEYMRTGDVGDEIFLAEERRRIGAHKKATGGCMARHEHGGNCMVCGASAIYTALFYHADSNEYIRTGFDCADKMHIGDKAAFRTFRKNIADARNRKAGRAKAQVVLTDLGLMAAWAVYESDGDGSEEQTIRDIIGRLVQYGSISDKQANFVTYLLDKIGRRAEIAAERAAEHAAASPCPEGRVEITGQVVKVEWRDNEYGGCNKMTVKSDEGYLVWGTMPRSLCKAERGDRVKFTATTQQSDRDDKFGFYSRPAKGTVLCD